MNNSVLIKNALIVNENQISKKNILIKSGIIEKITENLPENLPKNILHINAEGKILIPGIIDDQVHFREPGLTHKGDIYSESRAAAAGGITSFMEMPNTVPQTVTQKLSEEKYELGAEKSAVNYSFYIGATNHNIEELRLTDPKKVCGIKVFMGSSTGNMLVDKPESLRKIFSLPNILIACHCEDEQTIQQNLEKYKNDFGEDIPMRFHSAIRSETACYKSSSYAVELAKELGTRLHVLHLSTGKETELFENKISSKDKKITSEVCVHHLWFSETDYERFGTRIKWNPAIKSPNDREKLFEAVLNNKIDVIATDHAPHTESEKQQTYLKAPSGGPLVQHSLNVMLEFYRQGKITLEKITEKMCHTPADIFKIRKRGYIRKGYYADLVLIDLNSETRVSKNNILYKCAWSPFENYTFKSKISHTFVNGNLVYENGIIHDEIRGMRLEFDR
jgi:dihydroorotase